jgi:hypothetical protein
VKRFLTVFALLFSAAFGAVAQQAAPPIALPPPAKEQKTEFLKTADEMLAEMSKLLSLPILTPLKKSIRSRDEIRAYLLQKMKEDKDADKRYADQKSMEKFGLLPKDYPLEETLVKVLTEQIAGLYDPDGQEFFIADWTSDADQRMVMSHELTHALQDQHFHIDKWTDVAKPDDDAELARDAVIEGSAIAAMIDYGLHDLGANIRSAGDIDPTLLMGDPNSSPELAKAPKVIQDELMFPYLAGMTFTQQVLKASNGWPDFHRIFENPPASTQQIMHPDLYLQGIKPPKLLLPEAKGAIPAEWKKLDENNMGEFGLLEIFKQFLSKERSATLAATWTGDRYALFENPKNKQTLLLFRVRLASDADAARFFGAYSEVLELKYPQRADLMRRPNFFSFETPAGGVFVRCMGTDCLVLEGESREVFERLTRELGWPAGPPAPVKPDGMRVNVMANLQPGFEAAYADRPTPPAAP